MYFNSDTEDFYMGIVIIIIILTIIIGDMLNGKYHGKGLFYKNIENFWELNEYEYGKVVKNIKSGNGKP